MDYLLGFFKDDNKQRVFWSLLVLTTLVMLVGMGLRSPWPADEPRFVEVAREMVMGGEWLFPTRGGEFYPDKPPVFMWAIAACYALIGNLKLAFLIPNALCGLITVMLVYDLGCRLWSVRVGRNAALLLLLVPQFLMQAKNAQIDAMVACWITVGCYGLIRHFVLGPNWRWFFIAWGFMGLYGAWGDHQGRGFPAAINVAAAGLVSLAHSYRQGAVTPQCLVVEGGSRSTGDAGSDWLLAYPHAAGGVAGCDP